MTEQDAADADEPSADEEGSPDATDADGDGERDAAEAEATESAEAAADEESDDVDEQLIERVAESDPEEIAREIASLRTRVEGLEGRLDEKDDEIDDLETKLKRKQADFQNFKKRMEERREDEKRRATEDLVTRLLDVRDNLVRALEQDEDVDVRDGIESTLRQFDDELEAENVETIEPDPGAAVDPQHHQVLARVDSDHPEDAIDEVHRAGYVMGEKVLREAQVTVSDGGGD